MSYRIEYQWACVPILHGVTHWPGEEPEPRFVIAIEGGDNNVWVGNRRARDWGVGMIGTKAQILRQATRFAGECESGCLKPGGRDCTPEAYIGRIRRVLDEPMENSGVWVSFVARLPVDHPIVELTKFDKRFTQAVDTWYGEQRCLLEPQDPNLLDSYFRVIDPYLNDFSVPAWRVANVYGLRPS